MTTITFTYAVSRVGSGSFEAHDVRIVHRTVSRVLGDTLAKADRRLNGVDMLSNLIRYRVLESA